MLVSVRHKYHSWTYTHSWGPENQWTQAFAVELDGAGGERAQVERLLESFSLHCNEGREMLIELNRAGSMSKEVRRDVDVVRDIFLQSFDLLTMILSELKFVEIKVDQLRDDLNSSNL